MVMRQASFALLSSLGLLVAVGCGGRHEAVPSSARLVAEDKGNIDFIAPGDGFVFIEDENANKLLYRGRMREGERLEVEPVEDRIAINGRTVRDQKIRDLNNVRVYFQREAGADVAGGRTRVRTEEPRQLDQPVRSRDGSEIIVQPRGEGDADTIRVRPGANTDAKVTVEPGDEGSKVTIQNDRK